MLASASVLAASHAAARRREDALTHKFLLVAHFDAWGKQHFAQW